MNEQERYEDDYQTTGERTLHFKGAEKIPFGSRVDAPPELSRFQHKKKRTNGGGQN